MQNSQSGGFLVRVDLLSGFGVGVDGAETVGDGSILGEGESGGAAGISVSWSVVCVFGVPMSTVFLGVTVGVPGGSIARVGGEDVWLVTRASVCGGGAMGVISSWIVLLGGGS